MSQAKKRLRGSITALITPFIGEEVDYDAFRAFVAFQIENGSHGIVVAGTTGEHSSLNDRELKSLFQIAVDEVHGRVPVIAGCGDNTPERAIALSHMAQEAHVDATLHIGGIQAVRHVEDDPASIQEALRYHFREIHDNTDLPIVMYNVPGRTGIDMHRDTVTDLANTLPHVIGIKDCNSQFGRLEELQDRIRRDDFSLLTGEDAETLRHISEGGDGCISVTANVAPALCSELQDAWRAKDMTRARDIHLQLGDLHAALFQPGTRNPQSVKYAVSQLHRGVNNTFRGDVLKPITPVQERRVRDAMMSAGIWEPERLTA